MKNQNDIKILAVCRNKRKIPRIRRLLEKIEYSESEKGYLVPSTDPKKPQDFRYIVSLDINGDFYCKCNWILYKPYSLGMKKYKQVNDCIHILAVKAYILIMNNK